MKDIYRGSFSEVNNIKNVLEKIGVNAFVANQLMAKLEPWVVTADGFNPVVLKVADEDYDKSIAVIKEYLDGTFSLED